MDCIREVDATTRLSNTNELTSSGVCTLVIEMLKDALTADCIEGFVRESKTRNVTDLKPGGRALGVSGRTSAIDQLLGKVDTDRGTTGTDTRRNLSHKFAEPTSRIENRRAIA